MELAYIWPLSPRRRSFPPDGELALVAGLLQRPIPRTRKEVASLLRHRLSEFYPLSAWDEFICVAIADPRLEAIRNECIAMQEEAMNEDEPPYLTAAGRTRLKELLEELEAAEPQ